MNSHCMTAASTLQVNMLPGQHVGRYVVLTKLPSHK
jgi:hypothetical protein